MMRACLIALASCGGPATAAKAEESDRDTVVVTGSRLQESAHAAAVEIIDADTIASRVSGSLSDLLRGVPGLAVSQPGGPGGFTEVFVDGAESNFTMVMIDGVKVNDPTDTRGGAFDFGALGVDEIERIEIVRGPVSAIYGSEALAGVINVITRASSEEGLRAAASKGSYGYSSYSARLATQLGDRAQASLRASYDDAGEPVSGSTMLRKAAQADVTYRLSDRFTADAAVRIGTRTRTSFPDASGGPRYAVLRDLERSQADDGTVSARLRYAFTSKWSIDLTGSIFRRDDELSTPAIAPGISQGRPAQIAESRFEQSQLTLAARYAPTSQVSFAFGVEERHGTGRRDSELDFGGFQLPSDFSLRRDTRAAFFEAAWRLRESVELFGGVRRDHTEGSDDQASSRLGAVYRGAADRWQLRASWGEGFKLPSFYALGDALTGNPDLASERGTSFDLEGSLRLLNDSVVLGARGFSSVYRDLIDFDFATFRLVNRSRADIDGIGVSAAVKAGAHWQLALDATRTHTELASGGALLNRPDEMARVSVTWQPLSRWTIASALQYVGDRASSSVATGDVTLESYARIDLAATYRLSAALQLQGAVDNVLGRRYEDAPGFPSPGRLFRIGFRSWLHPGRRTGGTE